MSRIGGACDGREMKRWQRSWTTSSSPTRATASEEVEQITLRTTTAWLTRSCRPLTSQARANRLEKPIHDLGIRLGTHHPMRIVCRGAVRGPPNVDVVFVTEPANEAVGVHAVRGEKHRPCLTGARRGRAAESELPGPPAAGRRPARGGRSGSRPSSFSSDRPGGRRRRDSRNCRRRRMPFAPLPFRNEPRCTG